MVSDDIHNEVFLHLPVHVKLEGLSEADKKIWRILATVEDPEIPVLSVLDLGIVREVRSGDPIIIKITPTYSGCPAMDMIAANIRIAMITYGYKNFRIENVLAPAWTTAWITKEGHEKLLAYGIAPPKNDGDQTLPACPQCGSAHTKLLSQFASTACKALYQCTDCQEPFDYFKCH